MEILEMKNMFEMRNATNIINRIDINELVESVERLE